MNFLSSAALKLTQTFLYALTLSCASIVLGLYSYFLAVLADRDLPISASKKAVEGISGAAVLYLIFAVLLTCFLGGISFFALLAIVLDVTFVGGFIAIAVLTRDGVDNCSGSVNTPLGNGPAGSKQGYGRDGFGTGEGENTTYAVSLGTACRMNTACFAVSIVAVFLFVLSTLVQVALARNHQRDKRYGPSPANNYTYGSGHRLWSRRPKSTQDAELATVSPAAGMTATRPSHETGYTGSTVAPPQTAAFDAQGKPITAAGAQQRDGYYSQQQGGNPYGYDDVRTVM